MIANRKKYLLLIVAITVSLTIVLALAVVPSVAAPAFSDGGSPEYALRRPGLNNPSIGKGLGSEYYQWIPMDQVITPCSPLSRSSNLRQKIGRGFLFICQPDQITNASCARNLKSHTKNHAPSTLADTLRTAVFLYCGHRLAIKPNPGQSRRLKCSQTARGTCF